MRQDKKALCSVDNLNMINTPGVMIGVSKEKKIKGKKHPSLHHLTTIPGVLTPSGCLLYSAQASRLSQKPLKYSSQRHRCALPAPLALALWPLSFLRESAREGGSPFLFVPAKCASYNPALLQSACRQHSCAACKCCSKAE
jgi:hypothetical protein